MRTDLTPVICNRQKNNGTISIVKDWTAANNIKITDKQLDLLSLHQNKVLETNKQMNLTAITNPTEFAVKHIIDSLSILPYIPQNTRVADIGTGAGFPGIVLAIMRDDIHVTLIDSLRKRIFFLQQAVDELALSNVTCIHARAEDLARGGIAFDICTARAVASLDKLAKWVLPITEKGGTFLAMKGPCVSEELEKAKPAIAKQGGQIKSVDVVEISPEIKHSIVVIERNLP